MSKSSNKKPYYQNYALVKDPFPIETFDNTLILTPELNHRLDRIKSLITFSDKLVVVTASFGAGKSILADYLESIPEKNWKVSLVEADIKMERELLSYEIIQQFTPDRADVPAKSIPQLHKYLEFASKNEIIPVIIVDDAHKLPTATLEFILELAALVYGEARFRFVLFADETITDRLEQERLADLTSALVHKVNLPVMSMEQLKEYLTNRISASGEINKYPFTDEDLKTIFHRTGGVPRSINIVAREIMEAKMDKGAYFKEHARLVAGVAIACTVLIAVLFTFFQEDDDVSDDELVERYQAQVLVPPPPAPLSINEQANQQDIVDNSQSSSLPVEEIDTTSIVAAINDDFTDQQLSQSQAEESEFTPPEPENVITSDSAEIEIPTTTMIIDEPGTVASNLAMAEQAVEDRQTQPVLEEEIEIETPVPDPKPEPVAAMSVASASVSYVTPGTDNNIFKLDEIPGPVRGIRGENWYRDQPRSSYALQLISASDISNVLNLLEGLDEYHDQMSGYIKYTPSGRPRYVLFFGWYPDRDSASTAATDSVPDKLKRIKPYPRSIGSVIDEIEEMGYWPR